MILIRKFWDLYYKLFPNEYKKKLQREEEKKRAKERQENAELLLEHQELIKKREEMILELQNDAHKLTCFSGLIFEVITGDGFKKRLDGTSAKSMIESFDVDKINNYEKIKEKTIECEKLFFRIFTIKQKLKLYGLAHGLEEE